MTSKIETKTAAAAEQVAGNSDLLEEILVHLPPKSVTRFKLVAKQWLSQISDAQFVHRHSQHIHTHRKFHTGMFVTNTYNCISRFADFVSFADELNRAYQISPSLEFLYDGIEPPVTEIEIINSCNGLVLCAVSWNSPPFDYCVCNPTTKTFRMLGITRKPLEACRSTKAFALLAFDPSVSLHYKVFCSFEYDDRLFLYSFEDQSWICYDFGLSSSGEPFFLNGSIYYWLDGESTFLCFEVYTELMKPILLPPMKMNPRFCTFSDAFGSHLYVLYHQNPTPDLRVCEMSSDFSEWVTKYNESVGPLLFAFPQISYLLRGQASYRLKCITVVEGGEEDESQLVIGIPGKLLLYNLKDKTTKELCNLLGELDGLYGYIDVQAFQFVETLSVV